MAEKCNKCGGWISLEFISVTNDTQWCKCNKGNWTKEAPTEPGWYWMRNARYSNADVVIKKPVIVEVMPIDGVNNAWWFKTSDEHFYKEYLGTFIDGEWSERIEPPE